MHIYICMSMRVTNECSECIHGAYCSVVWRDNCAQWHRMELYALKLGQCFNTCVYLAKETIKYLYTNEHTHTYIYTIYTYVYIHIYSKNFHKMMIYPGMLKYILERMWNHNIRKDDVPYIHHTYIIYTCLYTHKFLTVPKHVCVYILPLPLRHVRLYEISAVSAHGEYI